MPLLDLGVFYRIGTTGAALGVAIRNFGLNASLAGNLNRQDATGQTITETDFEGIVPPTTLLLGIRFDVLRRRAPTTYASRASSPARTTTPSAFNVGAEYGWNDLLSLRAGYRFGVEEAVLPTLGFGLHVPGLGARATSACDYGFSQIDRLGAVHRIGVNLRLY